VSSESIVVIQTQHDMPPGLLAAWAHQRGLALDVRHVDRIDELPDSAAAVAILGSDASVAEPSAPWLEDLRTWTAGLLDAGVPAFGIAFGAQLIAELHGADVVRAAAPEIGWVRVSSEDPWLAEGPWLAWHRDVILPSGELRVSARNRHGIQAFTAGEDGRHVGVQFHPEATTAMIAGWAQRSELGGLADHAALNAQTARSTLAATASSRRLFDRWLQGVALPRADRVLVPA
jgi:GMP synthase (glutamine-hydrolysing)